MGVDYTGNYGIGIKIFIPELDENHEYYNDEIGYLESLLEDTSYSYFEVGEGSYTGNPNDYYIEIKNPFEDGYDIQNKVNALMTFLDEKQIESEGRVDIIGGLNVW